MLGKNYFHKFIVALSFDDFVEVRKIFNKVIDIKTKELAYPSEQLIVTIDNGDTPLLM